MLAPAVCLLLGQGTEVSVRGIPGQEEGAGNDVIPQSAAAGQPHQLALLIAHQADVFQGDDLNVPAHHLLHSLQGVGDGDGLRRFTGRHLEHPDILICHLPSPPNMGPGEASVVTVGCP